MLAMIAELGALRDSYFNCKFKIASLIFIWMQHLRYILFGYRNEFNSIMFFSERRYASSSQQRFNVTQYLGFISTNSY